MEKCHGTSAHLAWKDNSLRFFSGGESHDKFVALFDQSKLTAAFTELGHAEIIVYGEAYGGKQQGMRDTYGDKLKFVAFDVKVGDSWLNVPLAEAIVTHRLGLEFVHYVRVPTDIDALNAERDKPSVQAIRNGITVVVGDDVTENVTVHPKLGRLLNAKKSEGIVLRPLIELTLNNGDRIIAKHKRDDFRETATARKVVDPSEQKVLDEAEAIAAEWVVPMRLEHVLQKLEVRGVQDTPLVIKAMLEDIHREAQGEIVESKAADKAISRATAQLFKKRFQAALEVK